jgi:hypothetical protein
MRAMGGWIALTPELPAKLLLGRHVWDCAQHADLWGRRLPELRAHAQESSPANDQVVRFMDLLESAEGPDQTPERLAGVYRVLKPHLRTVYARHLASTNPIYEPPTRRILVRCVEEERRHVAAADIVIPQVVGDGPARRRADAWADRLGEALAGAGGVTGDVTPPLAEPDTDAIDPQVVAQDLVTAPPPFEPRALPADLAVVVAGHARALAAGDLAAALAAVGPDGRADVATALRSLRPPFERADVVALARIGRYRVVKLRLRGGRGDALVQERWVPSDAGWRLAAAEVLPAGPTQSP